MIDSIKDLWNQKSLRGNFVTTRALNQLHTTSNKKAQNLDKTESSWFKSTISTISDTSLLLSTFSSELAHQVKSPSNKNKVTAENNIAASDYDTDYPGAEFDGFASDNNTTKIEGYQYYKLNDLVCGAEKENASGSF